MDVTSRISTDRDHVVVAEGGIGFGCVIKNNPCSTKGLPVEVTENKCLICQMEYRSISPDLDEMKTDQPADDEEQRGVAPVDLRANLSKRRIAS